VSSVLVLDLDDTLYLERDYVRSGFLAVSDHLARREVTGEFFPVAWDLFERGKRGSVFDEALEALGIDRSPSLIRELVEVYRSHKPSIALCPDAARFLKARRGTPPLALVTDGPVASQSAKIEALALGEHFALLILTDEWGLEFRKPHARAFQLIEDRWPDIPPSSFTYLADNPLKDFVTPKARGWRTIRIAREGGEHRHRPMAGGHAADATIATFEELPLGI
jgi:putative hydrolase of the HAD superfamily